MLKRLKMIPVVALTFLVLTMPVLAEKGGKGQGAGGAREEHASEKGLEKGKAWAGSKAEDEEDANNKSKKGDEKENKAKDKSKGSDKDKKDRKDKKEKKDKK